MSHKKLCIAFVSLFLLAVLFVLFNSSQFGESVLTGFAVLNDAVGLEESSDEKAFGKEQGVLVATEKTMNETKEPNEGEEINVKALGNGKRSGGSTGAFSGGSVSDSQLVVASGNEPNNSPLILGFSPSGDQEIERGETISFFIEASDLDGDALLIEWFVNEQSTVTGNSFEFDSTNYSSESHKIIAVASDGKSFVSKEWVVTIVQLQPIIKPEDKIHSALLSPSNVIAGQRSGKEKMVKALISVEEGKILMIEEIIKENNGVVKKSFAIGNVIVAELNQSRLMEIAKQDSVISIWPDFQVTVMLDTSTQQIAAPVLWNAGYEGENVRVAVLDTGIDSTHPMLQGKIVLENNFSTSPTVSDIHGHGTHVAGIIAGTMDSNGLYNGVAPQALLYNAKVLSDTGEGTMAGIIAAINWAVDPDSNPATNDHAQIINLSLGASVPYNSLDPIHNVISEAVENGVLVVIASGNCGWQEPSSTCQGYIGVTTPGNNPNALSVGAVDDFNNWAPFSSGENIAGVGIKPDIVAPGVSIISSKPLNNYGEESGTSMSAPHATGAAALLLNANQSLTPVQIRGLLELNAIDLGATGKDTSFGFGLINLGNIINPNPILSEENISGSILESQVFNKNIAITNHGTQETLIYGVSSTAGINFSLEENSLEPAQSTGLNFSVNGADVGVGTFNGQIDINTNAGVKTIFVTLEVTTTTNPVIRSLSIPETIYRGQVMDIVVNATDDSSVDSVNVLITDPFGVTTNLPLVLSGDGMWRHLQYQFSTDPALVGRFDVNVVAVDNASNTTVFETHFNQVNALFFLPNEFIVNQAAPLDFAFKNTSTASKEATVVVEVYNETGFLTSELSQIKDVASGKIVDFNLFWTPESIGNYSLSLKFFEESTFIEQLDKNIVVLVLDALEITGFALDSNTITKGGEQTYSVWVENVSEQDLNAVIEINVVQNELVVDVITIEGVVVPAGSQQMFDTTKQVLFSAGSFEATTKLHYGNRIEEGLEKSFDVFTPANGLIESIILPAKIFVDQNHLVQIDFRNTGSVPLDVFLEGTIFDENTIVGSIDFNAAQVSPSSELPFTFESVHEFKGLSGDYLLKITANYEGNFYERDENLFVIDDVAPIISGLIFEGEVKKNDPFTVRVIVEEDSEIGTATLNVGLEQSDLLELSNFDDNHFLIGTYYDTSVIQSNDFFVNVCDEFDNCSSTLTQSFSVVDCVGDKLLLVAEEDYFAQLLEPSYCVSRWKKSESGVPALEYLQRFEALVWSESSNVSNIDENQAMLLEDFVSFGGKLLLEGGEIAFRHRDNNFMANVAHSKLEEDLVFVSASDSNGSGTPLDSHTIIVARNHPITQGLRVLDVNVDVSMFPDSVTPVNGGFSLADWNGSESAMIIFNDYNTSSAKGIFLPFNFNALEETVKPLLLENIVQWLLETSATDLAVNAINTPPYIVEQSGTIVEIVIENNQAAEVSIFVDGLLQATVPTSTGTAQANIDFEAGNHIIEAQINPFFSIEENNYLNNFLKKEVWVATMQADLTPESFSYSPQDPTVEESVQIDVNIQNIGGTSVNADIGFFVDENLVDTQSVYISYGGQATASAFWAAEIGVHDLRIAVTSAAPDSNSLNNELFGKLFVCDGSSVLVVSDDDTESSSGSEPSSLHVFESVLENNNYCIERWVESEQGVPSINYLNQFDALVWSAGDYWNTVLDENDMALLDQFNGNVLFEGSDIGFDNNNSAFLENKLHASFDQDLILDANNSSLMLESHKLLNGIASIDLNSALSPFPDSVIPVSGESIVGWSNAESAIVVSVTGSKTVYMGFSVDAITNQVAREQLILNLVGWLTEPNQAPQIVSVSTNSPVREGETVLIDVNAFDPDGDLMTYSIDSNLFDLNNSTFTWDSNYFSAGEYDFTLTVSDGNLFALSDVNVQVINVNRPPQIDSFNPANNPAIVEGESIEFGVNASDPDMDELIISWYVNTGFVEDNNFFDYVSFYDSAGDHNVTVIVSDGNLDASHYWLLTVLDVPIECFVNADCDDGIGLTEDICINPETLESFCEHNEIECIDSDGGEDYYVSGTVDPPGLTDFCFSDSRLVEYVCSSNNRGYEPIIKFCTHGCENGVCIYQETCPRRETLIPLRGVTRIDETP